MKKHYFNYQLAMNSNEINDFINQFGISNFLGVFAVDELWRIAGDYEGVFIFNTDPSYKTGQHWIAICISEKCLLYFDPLAAFENTTTEIQTLVKRIGKSFIYNNLWVQSYDSSNCGFHCLVFCFIMSKRPSLKTYTKYLKSFLSCRTIEEREQLSLSYFSIIERKITYNNIPEHIRHEN